jgi:predicted dehydrogenase
LYYPFVKQLKNIADSEEFGLISFRTIHKENFEFLKTHGLATEWNIASEQGGILWEVGCHLAYLQLHFLEDVKEVYAVGTRAKYPVYDEFYVILCAPSQRYGIIEVSWIAKEPEIMYEINGSDGRRVQAYLPHGYIIEKSNEAISSIVDVFRSFYLDQKRILKKWVKFGLNRVIRRPYGGHFDLIRSYIESIKKDQPPPVTAADGRNTIKLLESIEQSLNERRSVAVTITK